MIILTSRSRIKFFLSPQMLVLVFLCATGVLGVPVSAYGYSTDYEGYLGEIIALHGVSYNSDQIYLFMTGPGLPENGVTLTDTTQRADQGQFTTVDVDRSEQWSFKWDTLKLENQIDPGTYTVYAVNAPVDKTNLAGHSYQTLSVYLKDGKLSKDRVSVGTKYTLNLLDDDPVTTPLITTVTTVPPTAPPVTTTVVTIIPTTSPAPLPTTQKSPGLLITVLAGVALAVGIYLASSPRNFQ